MIAEFGNYPLLPNVVYAQSGWNAEELRAAMALRKSGRVSLVFNQNGWFYPGWHKGDSAAANQALVAAQRAADIVIFQSQFCLDAGRSLTGFVPPKYKILHNAVPGQERTAPTHARDGRTILLSAVFTPDTEHILRPAIEALRILRRRMDPRVAPRLILAGKVHPATRATAWFQEVERDLAALEADGACERIGEYRPDDLPRLTARADVALHLKYKDPCPNAVIERMALGLPHVFSNSGGTPELVGEAGIGLAVEETWDRQVAADSAALADAIDDALARRAELSEAARERCRRFDWGAYVASHRAIFDDLLPALG